MIKSDSFSAFRTNVSLIHCVKSVHIRSFSGPYFLAFGLNTESLHSKAPYSVRIQENTDQKNSEYRHFLHSDRFNSFMHNFEKYPNTF